MDANGMDARVDSREVQLLETELPRYALRMPSDEELRRLTDLVLGVPTRDELFEVRRGLMAFEPCPFLYRPPDGMPHVADGFEVAIIGAGLAGIAMTVQLEALGIPYVVYERRNEVGGIWSINRYPDIRVDTLSITYEYSYEDQYPWSESFARGAEVRGYVEVIARMCGVFDRIRFEHDLERATRNEARSTWKRTLRRADGTRVEREARAVEPEVRWLLDNVPGYWTGARYTSAIGLFTGHEDFLAPDPTREKRGGHITKKSEELRQILIGYIREQVGDRPDLIEKLIPDDAPMLRRPVVDNGSYGALTRDDVEPVVDAIARLTTDGIETVDGMRREVDLIVFATGYDVVRYLSPAEYRGRGGRSLRAFWGDDARAYRGMLVPDLPNLFMRYGPSSQPVSGGISLPSWFRIWAGYVAQCLVGRLGGGHASISVKQSAFDAPNERLRAEASGMAVVTDEGSAKRNDYLNASGRRQVKTPFETADLYAMQKAPDFEDFAFECPADRQALRSVARRDLLCRRARPGQPSRAIHRVRDHAPGPSFLFSVMAAKDPASLP